MINKKIAEGAVSGTKKPDIKARFMELYKEHKMDFYQQLNDFSILIKETFPDWKDHLIFHEAIGSTPNPEVKMKEEDFPGDYSIVNFFAGSQKDRQVIINKIKFSKLKGLVEKMRQEIESSSSEEKEERNKLLADFLSAVEKKFPDAEKYCAFFCLRESKKVVPIDVFENYDFPNNYSIEEFVKTSWPNKRLMFEAALK